MAKRRSALILAPLALALAPSAGAAWKFSPTLDATSTFSDNYRHSSDNEHSGFVTEVSPGFLLSTRGPRISASASYKLRYINLPESRNGDGDSTRSQLAANVHANLINELLYFDGSASISDRAISDFGSRSDYTRENQTSVKSVRASPYLRQRFGRSADLSARYTFDKVDTGRAQLGSSESNTLALDLNSGALYNTLGWNVSASQQEVDYDNGQQTVSTMGNVGLNLRVGRTLKLLANGGYDEHDYQALGGRNGGKSWSGGFAWTPSSRTSVNATAGRRYYGPSYYLSALHRSRHTVWNISYDDAATTSRDRFVLPAAVDTAQLLDSLFQSTIPDPVARQRAVDAYLLATGLPPSLIDNVQYFSNRFFLEKRFRASGAFKTARTRTVLTVYDARRNALSTTESDSVFQGPGSTTLSDFTRQNGVSGLVNYSLNSRSSANAAIDFSRTENDLTTRTAKHTTFRVGLTHQFKPRMRGNVELRRVTGPAGLRDDFREHAVSASLFMQL